MVRIALTVAAAALVTSAVAAAGPPRKLAYEDTIPGGRSGIVSVKVRASAAFKVLLRTSTQGRTRLYLTGTPGLVTPLMDTKTYACDGAAGSWYCTGSYEPLPKGTYTFRIRRDGPAAHVELTVRW